VIDLAFTLGMMPDQIMASDTDWIMKMLIANAARSMALDSSARRRG